MILGNQRPAPGPVFLGFLPQFAGLVQVPILLGESGFKRLIFARSLLGAIGLILARSLPQRLQFLFALFHVKGVGPGAHLLGLRAGLSVVVANIQVLVDRAIVGGFLLARLHQPFRLPIQLVGRRR